VDRQHPEEARPSATDERGRLPQKPGADMGEGETKAIEAQGFRCYPTPDTPHIILSPLNGRQNLPQVLTSPLEHLSQGE